jgi:DNA modification methylase
VQQLTLFDMKAIDDTTPANGGASIFSDPAFASNKTFPVHRWVPWIAGFSRDFVLDALNKYLSSKGTVLDPFAGVGTTLVEATLGGHDAIGFEINPYAALACQVKANVAGIDKLALEREILRFETFYREKVASGHAPQSVPPQGFRTRSAFYSPRVLHKVLIVQDFIATLQSPDLRDMFRLAFASTMVRYSNYSYEPSLGRRVSAGKSEIEDFAVGRVVSARLSEMVNDVAWFQASLARLHGPSPRVRVINDSFFNYRRHLPPESVDLVVTSPPYLNNYHYIRNTRPQLYWLGFVRQPQSLTPLEEANFGKYWQTVRDAERIELAFSLPGSDLAERLEKLRAANPNKGVYGGNGWANYAASYFNDCQRFAAGIRYVLRAGGTALVVLGNSILQGISMPTDRYFGQIAESVGLELVDIQIPRPARVGNSIIQSDVRVVKAKSHQQLYEAVVEIRKK